MEDSQTEKTSCQTVGASPWLFGGAILVGAATCLDGVEPARFLWSSAGLGLIWFFLLALAWRRRSPALRLFIIFVQQVFFHSAGNGRHCGMLQGGSFLLGTCAAAMWLSRHWLYKFARLD